MPPGIKLLLISNCAIFVIYFLSRALNIGPLLGLFHVLSLIPTWVTRGALWQPFTYLFLHSPFGFGHILFNMLALWMFGSDLERDWGTRRFLNFYFFCGVGAGICDVVARLLWGDPDASTIGASGAIYGVLLAFGLLYPHRTVYFALLFPIPARIFVLILGAIAFLSTFGASGSQISHIAHLGGMVFGYVYLRHRPAFLDVDWLESYRQWKIRRARRKFEVYMKKRDRTGGGGWVN
jgi:membrane associated rhomboid family serine protease